MTTAVNKKSGKGSNDGMISELTTFWDILPGDGHADGARAAGQAMVDAIHGLDPVTSASTGLRDARLAVSNDGRTLLFATAFETEWDHYIDDAILVVGVGVFLAWMQHTVQGQEVVAWAKESGAEKFAQGDPEWEASMRKATSRLKAVLQSCQSPATGYFNSLSNQTLSENDRAQRVNRAFEQVLDDPAAAEALQQPALKPLLELAAD